MVIPEGYNHKATSQSFNESERVVIYYSKVDDQYLLQVNEDAGLFISKEQLALVVHAGTDVLEMS